MPRSRRKSTADDRRRFEHMLAAARDATRYIAERRRVDLDTDSMLRRALIHCVQVIGEAAARTSEEGRKRAPSIPWTQVVGMRHILVHVYDEIDSDAVWRVVAEELPGFASAVEAALAAWGDQRSTGAAPDAR